MDLETRIGKSSLLPAKKFEDRFLKPFMGFAASNRHFPNIFFFHSRSSEPVSIKSTLAANKKTQKKLLVVSEFSV